MDEAAYATTALDDDYDFSNVPVMAVASARANASAFLPPQCEQGGAACAAACERCRCRARCVNTPCSQPRHPSAHCLKASSAAMAGLALSRVPLPGEMARRLSTAQGLELLAKELKCPVWCAGRRAVLCGRRAARHTGGAQR